MENKLIIALHGFLGLPTDWEKWRIENSIRKNFIALNLWEHPVLNSSLSLKNWTNLFLEMVKKKINSGFEIELWGYSMGGRLALTSFFEAPELFSKMKIISSNPGLESSSEREERFKNDQKWATRFLTEHWDKLIQDWNLQTNLLESHGNHTIVDNSVHRLEKDFNRQRLALALENWSLVKQPNFWPKIEKIKIPIDWHAGSCDEKFSSIATRVGSLNPNISVQIHPNRGHRLII